MEHNERQEQFEQNKQPGSPEQTERQPQTPEDRQTPPKKDDAGIKRVLMATLGTVTEVVEKAADAVQGLVKSENIDRMAQKGEALISRVSAMTENAAEKVKGAGEQALDKVKKAWETETRADIKSTLFEATENLKSAFFKAEDALEKAAGRFRDDDAFKDLAEELEEHKSSLFDLIKRLKDVSRSEQDKVEEEWLKLKEEIEKSHAPLQHAGDAPPAEDGVAPQTGEQASGQADEQRHAQAPGHDPFDLR